MAHPYTDRKRPTRLLRSTASVALDHGDPATVTATRRPNRARRRRDATAPSGPKFSTTDHPPAGAMSNKSMHNFQLSGPRLDRFRLPAIQVEIAESGRRHCHDGFTSSVE